MFLMQGVPLTSTLCNSPIANPTGSELVNISVSEHITKHVKNAKLQADDVLFSSHGPHHMTNKKYRPDRYRMRLVTVCRQKTVGHIVGKTIAIGTSLLLSRI